MPIPRPSSRLASARAATLLTAALAAAPEGAAGQEAGPLELQRLTAPVLVDGVPDEAAWREVAPLPLTLYAPTFRGQPEQRTEIRVAYDDEHLYAAGWFYDSDPRGMRVNSLYRDRWSGDDAFALYIDTFNDNRSSKGFGTTPAGIRFDLLLSDDGATENPSWDTFWTARSTVTAEGWFAEVRIPFSSLGFQVDAEGRAVMGLTATRLVSRSGERVTFPATDPAFEHRRPSLARDVVLRGVRSRTPLYLTPYALTGRARAVAAGEPRPGLARSGETSAEVGLDVRYPLSGGLTLDLTANTDFAQVEADDQQVNLDRFPLFFPERRRSGKKRGAGCSSSTPAEPAASSTRAGWGSRPRASPCPSWAGHGWWGGPGAGTWGCSGCGPGTRGRSRERHSGSSACAGRSSTPTPPRA